MVHGKFTGLFSKAKKKYGDADAAEAALKQAKEMTIEEIEEERSAAFQSVSELYTNKLEDLGPPPPPTDPGIYNKYTRMVARINADNVECV